MEHQRADRVADLLVELVAEVLRKEIRDPRLAAITLTGAKVSKDLRHARIYFTLLTQPDQRAAASAGLKSATGFIRSKVAKQANLRFVPTIEFSYDESEEQGRRIDDLLNRVKAQ